MEENLMRIRKVAFALLWVILLAATSTVSAQTHTVTWMSGGKEVYLVKKADNFLILYDRSGSMAEKYNGTIMTKIQAERKILLEKNATLPDMDWQAGVYSFTPGNSYDNLVEYYPVQQYDKKMFSWKLIKMPLEPKGPTMLQQGLQALDNVLAQLHGKTVVFLFTDGQHSPVDALQSPGAIAKNLGSKYDVCFVVINTGTKSEQIATINSIASATPCSYQVPFGELLGNPEWMTNALFEVVEKKPEGKDMAIGYVFENILFDFDKANIKSNYTAVLAEAGTFMREHPEARVVLAGHTDSIGSKTYNMKLSHKRAASVRNYLVKKEGISADRITLSGFGYNEPVASNSTSEGRALNRRVQGIVTGMK